LGKEKKFKEKKKIKIKNILKEKKLKKKKLIISILGAAMLCAIYFMLLTQFKYFYI
jgi:hypothetical protein